MRHQESKEQQNIFRWAELMCNKYPALELLHSIPNGGKRDRVTAAILKSEGVKAGVSDIHLPVPKGGFASLYIELKATDAQNKKGSPAQREWIQKVNQFGNYGCIAVGFNEAVEIIEKYLNEEL